MSTPSNAPAGESAPAYVTRFDGVRVAATGAAERVLTAAAGPAGYLLGARLRVR